jgi:hypothetical protein
MRHFQFVITGWTRNLFISHNTNTSMYFLHIPWGKYDTKKSSVTGAEWFWDPPIELKYMSLCPSLMSDQDNCTTNSGKDLWKNCTNNVLIDELHTSWPASRISPTCMDCMFWISSLSVDISPAGGKGEQSVVWVKVSSVSIWNWRCSRSIKAAQSS